MEPLTLDLAVEALTLISDHDEDWWRDFFKRYKGNLSAIPKDIDLRITRRHDWSRVHSSRKVVHLKNGDPIRPYRLIWWGLYPEAFEKVSPHRCHFVRIAGSSMTINPWHRIPPKSVMKQLDLELQNEVYQHALKLEMEQLNDAECDTDFEFI